MSLLTGHTVTLYPDVVATDGDGNPGQRRPGTVSQPISGRWEYVSATEDTTDGQEVNTRADFRCRSFPAGFAGRVTYDGRDWDVLGEPTVSGLSPLTRHLKVRLVARTDRPI